MTTIFNDIQAHVPYTAPVKPPVAQTNVQAALPSTNADSAEFSNKKPAKKEKKGLIAGTKEFIANIKKFFSSAGIYIKGTAKGAGVGSIAGLAVFGLTEAANFITKKPAHGKGNVLGIVLGAVTAATTLAGHLWTASLDATEKASEIDHRYIGHKK